MKQNESFISRTFCRDYAVAKRSNAVVNGVIQG